MKKNRHKKILSLIQEFNIDRQEVLLEYLNNAGFAVTQATVSRDIKELNLVKTSTANNKYKYVARSLVDNVVSPKCINLLKETVVSVVTANNLIVVKTMHGSATTVSGIVEQLSLPGVLGVVGSGDSLLIVTFDNKSAEDVAGKLNNLIF